MSLTGNVRAFIYVHSSVCLVLVSSLNVTEIWSATSTKTSRNLLEKLFISKINPHYTAIYWHWFPNIHCAFFMFHTSFIVAVWDFLLLDVLSFFLSFFLFSRMEWQWDKCTELWRSNSVNCPSQNTKSIICKVTEMQKKKEKKKARKDVCEGLHGDKKIWGTLWHCGLM